MKMTENAPSEGGAEKIKFIHVADIHASRERLPQTLRILSVLAERAMRGDIGLVIFAGDFWDATITATKGSGFSDIISAVRELERHTRLCFVYGTPAHEPGGSLDAFASPRTMVLADKCRIRCGAEFHAEVIAIPEPRRSAYVSGSVRETDEAINSDMEKFLRSHAGKSVGLPRIVVCHGEVRGAVYQNGTSSSSPTAIRRELLQGLDADYYALGHIHLPQEVFRNAWYSGSACPKDFGEPHDGCYNLVEIAGGKTEVERVPFGLPTFLTLQTGYSGLAGISGDFTNRHVRIQFPCTKDEKKSLSVRQVSEAIRENTHALSVRMEPSVICAESAPKSRVAGRRSLVEKMDEYAKEKFLKVPEKARMLLQDIQDGTLIKLSFPQHSFELLSLSLRGAIGIRDGQHREDFELDFEGLDDGVVCLVGNCGTGKSCILENCHPYPSMLTREGPLKEHFFLKDSHRILVYRDENNLFYRISMLIDGKGASGKVLYFAETSKDRRTWDSVPGINGSLASYQEWVESTFGSIDVFLRTAFFAKEQTKGIPDISATTKGERMELLSKLAGIDHLKEVSATARELRKEDEKTSGQLADEVESVSRYEKMVRENELDIDKWRGELSGQEQAVLMAESELAGLRAKEAEFQKEKALREANSVLFAQYKKELDEKQELYGRLGRAVGNAAVYEKIKTSRRTVSENAPVIESLASDMEKKREVLARTMEQVLSLNQRISGFRLKISNLEAEEQLLESQLASVGDTCPTCGAPLSDSKKAELHEHIDGIRRQLKDVHAKKNLESGRLAAAERELKEKDSPTDLKNEIAEIESRLAGLQAELSSCERFISGADSVYTEYTYDKAAGEHRRLAEEIDGLQAKIDSLADSGTAEDVSDRLADAERRLQLEISRKCDLSAMIRSAEKENVRYRKELAAVSGKKSELKELKGKISAYLFIEDAFSNNGIPAVELRESAPEIAETANRILQDSYGGKFEVRFGSTSELKTRRKANEDFNIIVYDTENGDEKTIDLVSSGERIWIKQALFYAFSIVQMNRTGFNFRTRLIDESDGSLDGGLRPKYLKMVTSAHKEADARLTLLITHSQEIKDIAQQVIEI